MGGKVRLVTSKEDYDEILQKNKVVVVDFYATWCGPCRQVAPTFEEMSTADEFDSVIFLKVDVDELAEVAESQQVNAMPTFKIYKDGSPAETLVGANMGLLKEALRKAVG